MPVCPRSRLGMPAKLHHRVFCASARLLWLVFGAAAGGDNVEQPSLSSNCAGIPLWFSFHAALCDYYYKARDFSRCFNVPRPVGGLRENETHNFGLLFFLSGFLSFDIRFVLSLFLSAF